MDKVSEIMTKNVETCSLLDNMYEVALKMKELNVGAIPIVDEGTLVGMITDRDIVIRGTAEKHSGSTKVEEIMSKELITVTPETTTEEASRLMADNQVRRLPVVENGKLVGIVSLGDFAVRDMTDSQAKKALSEISESNYNGVQH
ncbi:inosine-5'-monophosphate dehydrogenase [Bacillus sp. FJAT-18017]|uniref:CBS domain-containing protein n=1 Tax=Bacillus sp. FJAT-18017 TaxID=1705566 RepID=UPI0006AE9733|nr:CBS domain-containing protein [Bacillus sp. FJAT-18017]ALC91112.1 inosine-5'-monophosphate dehydrogenase [Bacillus sp. FJAT-18017]